MSVKRQMHADNAGWSASHRRLKPSTDVSGVVVGSFERYGQ